MLKKLHKLTLLLVSLLAAAGCAVNKQGQAISIAELEYPGEDIDRYLQDGTI